MVRNFAFDLLLLLQFFALFGSWQVEGFNIFMHAKRICAALIASLCPAAAPVACSAIMQRQFRINCSFVLLHWLWAALCQAQCPCGWWWRCHFLRSFTEKMRLAKKKINRKKNSLALCVNAFAAPLGVQRSSRFNCSAGAHLGAVECCSVLQIVTWTISLLLDEASLFRYALSFYGKWCKWNSDLISFSQIQIHSLIHLPTIYDYFSTEFKYSSASTAFLW